MSEITEKFCEECGKNSPINVKFCKFCGVEFPKIDHPEYIHTNFPEEQQTIDSPYQQMPHQTVGDPKYHPPQQPNIPPQYAIPQSRDQMGYGSSIRKPPRVWEGGGLVKASVAMYSKPIESAQSLVEDPQAPNTIWIILLTALSAALVQYLSFLKTNFTEFIGDDDDFFDTYASKEGVQNYAMQSAIATFVIVFTSWIILSWLLALIIKNGLPQESYLLNAPSKSMRRLTGFLYIPTMFRNVAEIILLQFEDDRDASIKKGAPILNSNTPEISYLSNFSNEYFLILFIVAIIMAVITAMTLYRSIKFGLNHRGSSPALIAFLVILNSFFSYAP